MAPLPMLRFYSNRFLFDACICATLEERQALTNLVNPKATETLGFVGLANELTNLGGNGIANWIRGSGIAYTEWLHDVATSLKVDDMLSAKEMTRTGLSIKEMDTRLCEKVVDDEVKESWREIITGYCAFQERAILSKLLVQAYVKMTPEQKAIVDAKVLELSEKIPGKSLKDLTTSAAFLLVANAGGFATYTLMSTVISTLTLGVASFGVYTTASSMLSVLLGPLGFAALGLAAAYKLTSPDKQKSVQALMSIALIRARKYSAVDGHNAN